MKKEVRRRMEQENPYNSITHLLGAVAALAGTALLVVFASLEGDVWKIVSFSIYGATLFLLYLFSTLYHAITGKWKHLFQKFDHIAIYLLIAGTYTPLSLVALSGTRGWSIFAAEWTLALLGICLETCHAQSSRIIALLIYVSMGWLGMIAVQPIIAVLGAEGFYWLLAGGLFYTLGIGFYILGEKRPYFHTVWHFFVLAGSISHFMTIYFYML